MLADGSVRADVEAFEAKRGGGREGSRLESRSDSEGPGFPDGGRDDFRSALCNQNLEQEAWCTAHEVPD